MGKSYYPSILANVPRIAVDEFQKKFDMEFEKKKSFRTIGFYTPSATRSEKNRKTIKPQLGPRAPYLPKGLSNIDFEVISQDVFCTF